VEEALGKESRERQPKWTESIAVGKGAFVRETEEKLGIRGVGREVIGTNGSYDLREPETPYGGVFGSENVDLRKKTRLFVTYLLQDQQLSLVRPARAFF
jgi:hypothetical protein